MSILEYINEEHDGYYYDPESGRLFRVEEITVVDEHKDGSARHRKRDFKGAQRICTHIIHFIMTGKWPDSDKLIDHKDGNPWNNKWNNLREATYSQNGGNRQPRGRYIHDNKGLEMGVEVTPYNRYRVKVRGAHLGSFTSLEEANACSLAGRRAAYGEFDFHSREES